MTFNDSAETHYISIVFLHHGVHAFEPVGLHPVVRIAEGDAVASDMFQCRFACSAYSGIGLAYDDDTGVAPKVSFKYLFCVVGGTVIYYNNLYFTPPLLAKTDDTHLCMVRSAL